MPKVRINSDELLTLRDMIKADDALFRQFHRAIVIDEGLPSAAMQAAVAASSRK